MKVLVTLEISSSGNDPTWELDDEQVKEFVDLVDQSRDTGKKSSRPPGESKEVYKGFRLRVVGRGMVRKPIRVDSGTVDFGAQHRAIKATPGLENWLLSTGNLPESVQKQVKTFIDSDIAAFERRQKFPNRLKLFFYKLRQSFRLDFWTWFDPEKWDDSPTLNNCYNYAVDQKNDNCAQPGVAAGGDVLAQGEFSDGNLFPALEGDGLKRHELASPAPEGTHVIALATKRVYDYHFFRLDENNVWSHKSGIGSATNTVQLLYGGTCTLKKDDLGDLTKTRFFDFTVRGYFLCDPDSMEVVRGKNS